MVTRIEDPIGTDAPAEEREAKHRARASALLDHAEALLKKNPMTAADRLQVSEKIWGSVTHTLKAVAASQGWEFRKAEATDSMRAYLRRVSDDPTINHLFGSVHTIHINYYEDRYHKQYLADGVAAAKDLNRRLWDASTLIPADAPLPHGMRRLPATRRRAQSG